MKERGQNKQGGEWEILEETSSIQQAKEPEVEKKPQKLATSGKCDIKAEFHEKGTVGEERVLGNLKYNKVKNSVDGAQRSAQKTVHASAHPYQISEHKA